MLRPVEDKAKTVLVVLAVALAVVILPAVQEALLADSVRSFQEYDLIYDQLIQKRDQTINQHLYRLLLSDGRREVSHGDNSSQSEDNVFADTALHRETQKDIIEDEVSSTITRLGGIQLASLCAEMVGMDEQRKRIARGTLRTIIDPRVDIELKIKTMREDEYRELFPRTQRLLPSNILLYALELGNERTTAILSRISPPSVA